MFKKCPWGFTGVYCSSGGEAGYKVLVPAHETCFSKCIFFGGSNFKASQFEASFPHRTHFSNATINMVPPSLIKLSNNKECQLQPASLEDIPYMAEIFVIGNDSDVTVLNQMKDVPHHLIYQHYTTAFTSLFQNEEGVEFWKVVDVGSG